MSDVVAALAAVGIDLGELREALNTPPSLWAEAGPDRWVRPGGWLARTPDGFAELVADDDGVAHLHRYEPGGEAGLPPSKGSPLDGHRGAGKPERVEAPVDDMAAWDLLDRRGRRGGGR